MQSPGYNIFVTGLEGTGKSTIVRDIVTRHAQAKPTPSDWCMVNNFEDVYRPYAISLPAGKANQFSRVIGKVISDLRQKLAQEFEDPSYLEKVEEFKQRYGLQKKNIFETLGKQAKDTGLQIVRTPAGYQSVPVKDDNPMTAEDFQNLPEEARNKIQEQIQAFQPNIEAALRENGKLNQALQKDVQQLMEQVALFVVKDRLSFVKDAYRDSSDVLGYLETLQKQIAENVEAFIGEVGAADRAEGPAIKPSPNTSSPYAVNVLVDRKAREGAPVIFEPNPTYQNVFGRIEKRAMMGTVITDFTMVQAGSLLQANGGYLIMEIESVLMHPFVWEALKRALQNKQLFIEDIPSDAGFSTASLRPEPIPLEVKVILLGSYAPFEVLQNYDSKFNKIFKVRADFDYEVTRDDQTIQQYAQFIARVCQEEGLLPLTPDGVAAIVEFGEKYVGHQHKLSLRFGPIVGIIKEADYWARHDQQDFVDQSHVIKAFTEHRYRYNLYEEKMQESYAEETILIDVDSDVIGQVNALAVYQMGDISFGRPSRITAETYMGKKGLINIEREAKLSGNTHDKGVLILSGYLGRTFAQQRPLALSISITFEQSYSGIDGDSASSTELYAILSSLADIPINQGIAVTGSVNQKGEIQAIGGVNQKIEGFFDVCQAKGLTGKQGVMIPRSNVKNLMLKKEVVGAVEQGRFNIYQVATIEQGIEILTGVQAGVRNKQGHYPRDSVFAKVEAKLGEYLERAVQLSRTTALDVTE
jgi:lon-related putative ATP-dependent protease